jgi:hypothetical protein
MRSSLSMTRGGPVSRLLGVVGSGFRRRFRRPRAHQRGRWMLVAGMVPGAVTAAALFPAPAAADLTQGFDISNLSSHPIKLLSVNRDGLQGAPPDGAVLNPGAGVHHYERIFYLFDPPPPTAARYEIDGDDGKPIGPTPWFDPTMAISSGNSPISICTTFVGVCTPSGIGEGVRNIYLYDDPGTVHDLPASRAQAQAQALRSFCDQTNMATCQFTATSEQQVDSPTHQVGNALINTTDETQDTRVAVEDKVGSSDSVEVGVTAGGKLFELLDVEVSAKYDHKWTQEHTFSQDVTVHCPAHHKCWIDGVAPMYRDTGNFTVTMGNTTWNLTGVYFDSPDPTRSGSYQVNDCAIGDPGCTMQGTKLSNWPSNPPRASQAAGGRRKVLSGSYRVPLDLAVRGIVEPKLHHAIRGPSSVTAGGKASYRIMLSRRQPSDRLSYAVKGVRVGSTVAGRRARRWKFSTLRAFQSRKLTLKAAVPGSARGKHCVSVVAVAKHARAAEARHCAPVTGSRQFAAHGKG